MTAFTRTCLNQITLASTNVARSIQFYQHTLGLEPIVLEPPHYARFLLAGSNTTLSVEHVSQSTESLQAHNRAVLPARRAAEDGADAAAPTTQGDRFLPTLYFDCQDEEHLIEAVEELRGKGVEFQKALEGSKHPFVFERSWLWLDAHFEDPDGNQLALCFSGENRINPPWKYKA
ncbi:hypothetical protein HK104_008427 [Borealophlyctis nickersoniae]|nr:hypothetical protein HK104_008427 [Borealophlyctis nickersoniae]